jgi:hypothetical protein
MFVGVIAEGPESATHLVTSADFKRTPNVRILYGFMSIQKFISEFIYVYMYEIIYVYINILYVYILIYIYIYICIYTFIYICNIYTYMYMLHIFI